MNKENENGENDENKIVQIPIRMRKKDKEELKAFAEEHKKSFAEFARACMNFFRIRNTTPDKYFFNEGEAQNVDLSPLSAELSKIKEQLEEMNNALRVTRGISREDIISHIDSIYYDVLGDGLEKSDDLSEILSYYDKKMSELLGKKLFSGEIYEYASNKALDKLSETFFIKNGRVKGS
jgi:hypothetical protein